MTFALACLNSVLNVKAVVAAFNQEKALVGAFSVIVQLHRLIDLRHYRGQLICGLKCGDGWRLSIIWQPGPRSPQPPSCTYSASGDLGFSILSYRFLVLHAKSIPVTFEYCLLPTLI